MTMNRFGNLIISLRYRLKISMVKFSVRYLSKANIVLKGLQPSELVIQNFFLALMHI
jgi:hypothetical protein